MINEINTTKKTCLIEHYNIIQEMLNTTERMIIDSQEEANYHKGAMASRYDTFKEEAQYLVEAQQKRKLNLQRDLNNYLKLIQNLENEAIIFDTVRVGAGVSLSNGYDIKNYLLTPSGLVGGNIIIGEEEYQILSVQAPIIAPFIGKHLNEYADDIEHLLDEYYVQKII